MKKTLCILILGLMAPLVHADSNWESKYWDYANSIGDGTPIGQYEWGVRNGYLPDTSLKDRVVLNKDDAKEIARMNIIGDATPASVVVLSTGPRKTLSAEDAEYILFMGTYGDATPPSFEDWKASRAKRAR